jgi:tetratricopeptide (TPR) repeat protein
MVIFFGNDLLSIILGALNKLYYICLFFITNTFVLMTIIHLIDDFLSELFPRFKESGNDLDVLREDLEKFYSFGSYKPVVSIEGQLVRIEVDVPAIMSQEADFRRATNLCEAGKFQEAKAIMTRLIEKNPTHSEYHRVLGQVYSEVGDQDAAIDTLIEAWSRH